MAINNQVLTCLFLGTFLLLSFTPTTTLSIRLPRRSLKTQPDSTIAQFLNPHNQVRAGLGLPPLQWSANLTNFAQWWANQRKGDCALVHSVNNLGENIFWGNGRNWKAADAVAAWASEKPFYNYQKNSCSPNRDCSHYTQLVWKQTKWVGCAKVICNSGDTFITCNYDPHGNVIGQRPF